MTFTISPAIKQCWPETALGLLLYQVQVAPSSPQLLAQFDQTVASLAQQYTLDTIAKHPHIAATRQAYKALGASPHEHRNAAEAMLRRVVKQAGLYHINKKLGGGNAFWDAMNYENVGGTPVLGVNAPVIIGHGISSARAIKSMILSTEQCIKADLTVKLQHAFKN